MVGSYQQLHVSAFMEAIVRLYRYSRQSDTICRYGSLDVEISSTFTYIEFTDWNHICETVIGWTGCCSRLGVAVSGLASLVGVIYRLVGVCSGAWRTMSFLLGEKAYRVMSYLCVKLALIRGDIIRVRVTLATTSVQNNTWSPIIREVPALPPPT